MPAITSGIITLQELSKGAITRGEVEIETNMDFESVASGVWISVLELSFDVPSDARGLLLQNFLDINVFLGASNSTEVFYSRMNINDGDWTSPETTITLENKSDTFGDTSQDVDGSGTNMYLMTEGADNLETGSISIESELQSQNDLDADPALLVTSVLAAAILLR